MYIIYHVNRVGWGSNGEIIHAGKLLFRKDTTHGHQHRVVIEKLNTGKTYLYVFENMSIYVWK
jgi:hypothetical protein